MVAIVAYGIPAAENPVHILQLDPTDIHVYAIIYVHVIYDFAYWYRF